MPHTETFPLPLTDQELGQFSYRANIEGGTIASLIRWKLGLPKLGSEEPRKTSKTVAEVKQDMADA